jgi:hypothetical protein
MAIPFKRIKTQLDFLDTLGFGNKYMGKTISYIIEFDPEYLEWCCKKENLVYLTPKCMDLLEDRLRIVKQIKDYKDEQKLKKMFAPPKSKFKDWMAHSDQDDWWCDIPF